MLVCRGTSGCLSKTQLLSVVAGLSALPNPVLWKACPAELPAFHPVPPSPASFKLRSPLQAVLCLQLGKWDLAGNLTVADLSLGPNIRAVSWVSQLGELGGRYVLSVAGGNGLTPAALQTCLLIPRSYCSSRKAGSAAHRQALLQHAGGNRAVQQSTASLHSSCQPSFKLKSGKNV